MTQITCSIFKSGTTTPVAGFVRVVSVDEIPSTTSFYAVSPVDYPLVDGLVTFDLVPSDVAKVAYTFSVYQTDPLVPDEPVLISTFDAVVPFSAAPVNLALLATQSGLRYDRRDASLLTLARYLTSNDSFVGFFGKYLWNNMGLWNAATLYKRGDVVLRNGSSYQYIEDTQTSGLLPETNPATWTLLVSAGSGGGGGGSSIPVATMALYPTATAVPAGFLRCDGSAVSRTTYATLFATIGTAYGTGNGTTTFNLPTSPITGDSSFCIVVA